MEDEMTTAVLFGGDDGRFDDVDIDTGLPTSFALQLLPRSDAEHEQQAVNDHRLMLREMEAAAAHADAVTAAAVAASMGVHGPHTTAADLARAMGMAAPDASDASTLQAMSDALGMTHHPHQHHPHQQHATSDAVAMQQ
ncbi:TPA: hypothetical protein N0F65_012472 [Lagenidium giganteum]|uniref:Uncharacterized protein n=1 Tax=Lagenidium giganteum TaxID=4803 RepID=A0AAV2YGS7_9STRA|nr:TPA: hypothetical protein N0F65_012472 [Lagenidium giganteum]